MIMRGNLKAVGVVLVAVLAMSSLAAAQGASAAVEHEFHSDGEKAVVTGTNSIVPANTVGTETSIHEFTVGSSGVWKCAKVQTESTQVGKETTPGSGTWATDTITVVPHYSECTFGGNPATVNFHHCAYVFDSDTTTGNTTIVGSEHASWSIECKDNPITIATSVCTITIAPQEIKDAVRYENDPHNKNAIKTIWTAHNLVIGNLNDKGGCVLLPKGAVGKLIGTTTGTCFKDVGTTPAETAKTTPTEKTVEGSQTECKVSNL